MPTVKIGRHILIITALLLLAVGLSHWLPQWIGFDPAGFVLGKMKEEKEIKPPLPLLDTLRIVLNSQKSQKIKDGREVWTIGNGVPLPVYLLRAQRVVQERGGAIISMQEFTTGGRTQNANLSWKSAEGEVKNIQLKYGSEFLEGTSQIAIAFQLNAPPDSSVSRQLQSLGIPYTLLIRPFQIHKDSTWKLPSLDSAQYVAWIGMEPHQFPWVTPGNKPILIHHNASDIEEIIDASKDRIPQMKGVATFMGERAMEQEKLLTTLMDILKKKNLWFLDLTGSRFSRSQEICRKQKAHCTTAYAYDRSNQVLDYLHHSLKIAGKSGKAIALVPLTAESIAAISEIIPEARLQGTSFIYLSTLIP